MKRLPVIIPLMIAMLWGCKPGAEQNHTEIISKMEDTLFKSFPSVNRVSIEVKDDFGTEVIVTLGDKTLFNTRDAEREQAARKIGLITLYNFRDQGFPHKGKVVFVKEENSIISEAQKTSDMHLDELQKDAGITETKNE